MQRYIFLEPSGLPTGCDKSDPYRSSHARNAPILSHKELNIAETYDMLRNIQVFRIVVVVMLENSQPAILSRFLVLSTRNVRSDPCLPLPGMVPSYT